MKKGILILMVGLLCSSAFAQKKVKMENEKDSVSYALGIVMAKNLKQDNIDVDTKIFAAGFKAYTEEDKKIKIDEESATAMVNEFFVKKQEMERAAAKQEGVDFLAKNGNRKEVTTTSTGLQYEVLTEGTGVKPISSSSVTVHYTGTLINGKVFDSSVERGQPATFGVGQVIPGWTEALQLMSEGAKWKLYIPSELGYGERGAGKDIAPNSTLIFEVELITVN